MAREGQSIRDRHASGPVRNEVGALSAERQPRMIPGFHYDGSRSGTRADETKVACSDSKHARCFEPVKDIGRDTTGTAHLPGGGSIEGGKAGDVYTPTAESPLKISVSEAGVKVTNAGKEPTSITTGTGQESYPGVNVRYDQQNGLVKHGSGSMDVFTESGTQNVTFADGRITWVRNQRITPYAASESGVNKP